MNAPTLHDLTPEWKLIVLSCSQEKSPTDDELGALIQGDIDWNQVLTFCLWHKVLFIVFHRLRVTGLLDKALSSGRIPLLLLNHMKELYRINIERNRLHAAALREVAKELDEAGVNWAVAKGGPAMFGRTYDPAERKCYDIDLLAERRIHKPLHDALGRCGFDHWDFDQRERIFRPIPRTEIRKWLLHARGLPNYVKPIENATLDYLIVQVQFVVGSSESDKTIPASILLEEKVQREGIWVLSDEDVLIQLCLHLHRETTESAFRGWQMSWNLIKFCDLARFSKLLNDTHGLRVFAKRAETLGFSEECIYAFTLLRSVFPHPTTEEALQCLQELAAHRGDIPTAEEIWANLSQTGQSGKQSSSNWSRLVAKRTT